MADAEVPEQWKRDPAAPLPAVGDYVLPPVYPDEDARMEALNAYRLMDTTENDSVLNAITAEVARELGVDIALVSLVFEEHQAFQSRQGLDAVCCLVSPCVRVFFKFAHPLFVWLCLWLCLFVYGGGSD